VWSVGLHYVLNLKVVYSISTSFLVAYLVFGNRGVATALKPLRVEQVRWPE